MKTIAAIGALVSLLYGCGGAPLGEADAPCVHPQDCAEGFACVGTVGVTGDVCRPMCHTAADCGGAMCDPLIGVDDFGVCAH